MANSELPQRANKRGGPGWWMDLDGSWRAPEEWPEDTAPIDGWMRNADGIWGPPTDHNLSTSNLPDEVQAQKAQARLLRANLPAEAANETRLSRQANADRKAMFTVVGAFGGAALLLAVALILITQAGAEDDPQTEPGGAVIFAAETEQLRMERRAALAIDAPNLARQQLEALPSHEPAASTDTDESAEPVEPVGLIAAFDPVDWIADRTDCLDIAEDVLVSRSQVAVTWADQLECVPHLGSWTDRYLDSAITRTLDADVRLHVPAAVAHASGGAQWSTATRQAYVTDTAHPATLIITKSGGGHNPREQGPNEWKPANSATWCAYAIDWVAVKTRWELGVTSAERTSLTEMIDTCGTVQSSGPDLYTMPIDPMGPALIERTSAE